MKKISHILAIFLILAPGRLFAAIDKLENPTPGISTLYDFVKEILTIIVKIGIPIATVFIIWSGFLFLTAQGDETQLKKAKASLLWTCVGTAVLLGAWVLATAIKGTVDQL